jgi:Surface-adhesin protein E
MHKTILMILLLAVVSSNAVAEWVAIGTGDGSILYANPNTFRKSGNIIKMWTLTDYNSAREIAGEKFLSEKSQEAYDCKEEQAKMLYFSWHSENMGKGNVVFTANKPQRDWTPVAPDSIGEVSWKFACGK